MLLVTTAFALEVSLHDTGTLSGDWAADVQAGESDEAKAFLAFLAQGMLEQSFTLQHTPLSGTAGMPGEQGFALGVGLDSFTFRASPVNGQGKEENTKFSPVLPRILASWNGGERLSYGAGVSLVPPISVGGASAMVVGGDVSVAYAATGWFTAGAEIDASAGYAYAPVVATPEARESGVLENVNEERYESVCVPQPFGCLDTLNLRHGGAHAVFIFAASELVQPWLRVGGRWVDERFIVQVDLSEWRVSGLLPTAGIGANLVLHPSLRAGIGGFLAPLPDAANQNGELPLIYRFSGQIAWVPKQR